MSSEEKKDVYLSLNDPLKSHAAEAKVFKMLQREPFFVTNDHYRNIQIEIFTFDGHSSIVHPKIWCPK